MTEKTTKESFVDFERGFLIKSSFAAILISVIGLIINIAIQLGTAMYVIPVVAIFIYGWLFFLANSKFNIVITKWIFVVITFVFLNFLWVFNYGSYGPAPYFFILIYTLLIFVFSKMQLRLVTLVLAINIAIFFFLDIYYPGVTENYQTDLNRIVDVYTGLIIYFFIIFGLITNAKNHFIKEYHKAKTSDNLKANFLDNISHEIRTPLNAIVGFSSILSMGGVSDEERKEYVEAINESTDALLKIVTEILDVSQIEAGGTELIPEKISIKDCLSLLKVRYEKLLIEKGKPNIDFVLHLPEKETTIIFDKIRFEQIFEILLSNSMKFTENGVIEVGFEIKYSKYLFWVRDTGTGIKEEFKEQVFKSFTRNEKSTSGRFGGTGIGLFLASAIVRLHKGEIWFKSVYGEGTTFFFSIPRHSKVRKMIMSE
jgi:signal transduction histidine kinase